MVFLVVRLVVFFALDLLGAFFLAVVFLRVVVFFVAFLRVVFLAPLFLAVAIVLDVLCIVLYDGGQEFLHWNKLMLTKFCSILENIIFEKLENNSNGWNYWLQKLCLQISKKL
ncbi:MAG: hypothetical protein GWN40_04690 [Nitrosopumilaceae archaeon]|nr:hypothetical protein [Nitrosopumilaceae archaeon]